MAEKKKNTLDQREARLKKQLENITTRRQIEVLRAKLKK